MLWIPASAPPEKAGYYLVTVAPINWAEGDLEGTQDYCEEFSGLAWFNPDSGPWWRASPGLGPSIENAAHVVTHWAHRPKGARPTQEQLDALPERKWTSWWDRELEGISKALVFDRKEEALRLIREQLIPMLEGDSDA